MHDHDELRFLVYILHFLIGALCISWSLFVRCDYATRCRCMPVAAALAKVRDEFHLTTVTFDECGIDQLAYVAWSVWIGGTGWDCGMKWMDGLIDGETRSEVVVCVAFLGVCFFVCHSAWLYLFMLMQCTWIDGEQGRWLFFVLRFLFRVLVPPVFTSSY